MVVDFLVVENNSPKAKRSIGRSIGQTAMSDVDLWRFEREWQTFSSLLQCGTGSTWALMLCLLVWYLSTIRPILTRNKKQKTKNKKRLKTPNWSLFAAALKSHQRWSLQRTKNKKQKSTCLHLHLHISTVTMVSQQHCTLDDPTLLRWRRKRCDPN